MSRHRMIRNLNEDDYYDDYDDDDDDYYDEEENDAYYNDNKNNKNKKNSADNKATQQQYAPPSSSSSATSSASTMAIDNTIIAVAGKTAITASVGVTKPPVGWGKPSASSDSRLDASAPSIMTPPPGWGKPNTSNTAAPKTNTKPKPTTASASASAAAAAAAAAGVSKPPAGWGKPSNNNNSNKNVVPPPKKKTTTKPLPDILKNTRSQLSMVVLGHVDAGKSTLVGQLLVQTGQITKRNAAKQQHLSWLLDENESERERGVTMEIGTKGMSLKNHDIVLLDAPGHADFIPVMITGAANADVAILVIAAVRGEFEAGFHGGGQTKEHVMLARGLGVTQVIVAINKLDVVASEEGWNQSRYDEIQQQVKAYLLQQQFKPKRIQFVPVSGLTGENVFARNKEPQWYNGPTLLEAIDGFQPANRHAEKPLRFVVSDVWAEGKGVVARGRVVQGFLEVGESLVVLPIGDTTTVSKLEHVQPPDSDNPKRLAIAMAGDTIELTLNGMELMRLSVGSILSNPNPISHRPKISKRCIAKLLVMDPLAVPIIRGAQVLFHMHSLDVPAVLSKLTCLTNPKDGTVKKERPRALPGGSSAVVEMTLSERVVLEPFAECRALGRFVLRRGGDTIAVGVIDQVL